MIRDRNLESKPHSVLRDPPYGSSKIEQRSFIFPQGSQTALAAQVSLTDHGPIPSQIYCMCRLIVINFAPTWSGQDARDSFPATCTLVASRSAQVRPPSERHKPDRVSKFRGRCELLKGLSAAANDVFGS
jgi:hypothetical protein